MAPIERPGRRYYTEFSRCRRLTGYGGGKTPRAFHSSMVAPRICRVAQMYAPSVITYR